MFNVNSFLNLPFNSLFFSFGPLHSKKLTAKFDCELEVIITNFPKNGSQIQTIENELLLNQTKSDLKYVLSKIILLEEYPKSFITISFEILESNGPVFAHLINLLCASLNFACIKTLDIFSSSISVNFFLQSVDWFAINKKRSFLEKKKKERASLILMKMKLII